MMSSGRIMLIIILGLVLVPGLAVADNGGTDNSELHCALGSISLVLLIGTLLTGPLLKGRFGQFKGPKPYPLHRYAMIILSIYLTGVFIFGVVVADDHNPFRSVHGVLGFLIVLVTWAAVALRPCTIKKAMKRNVISGLHRATAILLVVAIVAQLLYAFLVMGS